jgi:folate-binding protein YgfZ
MKAEWKAFLANAGAEFDTDGKLVGFGNPEREREVALSGNIFADLSHYSLVAVHGEDALDFLQGQFSNDLRRIDEGHSLLNAYCSPKGRMLANFRVFHHGDSFYLRMPSTMVEATMKRLRMFVMRSRVTIEDTVDTFIGIGLSGPGAEGELARATNLTPPAGNDDVIQNDHLLVIRVPGIHPRFEIYAGFDAACRIWNALNVDCAPVGTSAWNLLEIQAGLPTIHPETAEAFVPQMANLQLVDGVSFKKGCYPGQEVVARMQYLGKLKRRMYLARVQSSEPPCAGQDLFDVRGDEQSVGKVVDAEPHPDGGYSLLAVVQIASAEQGDVRLGDRKGPVLEYQTLPYAFPAAESA